MSRRLRALARSHPLAAFAGLLLAGLALGLAGCDADSPSEPPQQPGTPPGTGGPSATYNITITLSPPEIPAGSADPVQVTVRVVRTDNGQPPPTGTTIILAAGGGAFGAPDGPSSVVVQTVNGQVTVPFFPPLTVGSGTVVIQARLESSIGQATLRIAEPATFFIASVSPSTGSPNGGDEVTIQGGGFAEPVRVTFDGVPAQVLSVSANRIRVITPPAVQTVPVGGTLPVPVSVTINLNELDQAIDTLPSAFIYARGGSVEQPLVFSVTPASGPNEGGTRITINGEGFQAPVQVFFGQGASATSFTGIEATVESVSSNQIVVRSPTATGFGQNNLNQVVDILVKNLNTGFATVAPQAFQYGAGGGSVPFISAISPGEGPFTGGTRVVIQGQGFDEPVAVSIAGVGGQPVISVTGTQVVFRTTGVDITSCGDVSGAVSLVNVETGEGATGPVFTFRVPRPRITGVSPSSGPQAGNTLVTITGGGFQDPVRVRFCRGGTCFSGTIVAVSGNEIEVRTPGVTNDVLETEACDDNADATLGERFIRTAFDLEVVNLVSGCEDSFDGAFTFVPADSSCRND
ncbi:MAG TPA: IPT/TIG domain-containing protein, partial [Thermoanaerobaculia bacterium]|nr:IPT/TIG domain-containing protein [Thermoanaerobaculia bacterium]